MQRLLHLQSRRPVQARKRWEACKQNPSSTWPTGIFFERSSVSFGCWHLETARQNECPTGLWALTQRIFTVLFEVQIEFDRKY